MNAKATKPKKDEKPKTKTSVAMERELAEGEEGPTKADVHPDEVKNWKDQGWKEA